jgi:ribosomal protein S18 acetylase RimI-like enzyme
MPSLSFRKASREEAGFIAALVNACYRGESSRRGWTSEADLLDGTRTDREEVEALIDQEGAMILLCIDGTDVIGSVHLQLSGTECHLGMLVVRPDLQGRGIGRRLMQAAESTAQQKWGVTKMSMTIISLRHELIAFYERRGYRRTGQRKPFVADGRHGIPRAQGIEFEVLEKGLDVSPSAQ